MALARLRAVAAERKIVSITAWDFPSGLLAETAGMDLVLVGDSLGMAALGHKDTKAVTLDDMVHHTRAVTQAVKSAFVLGDLPLGSYEKSTEHAIESAIRLIKEGGADGVKLEGGVEMSPAIKAISDSGIPVIGHIGLTLQRGLDVSNRGDDDEDPDAGILTDARSVQDAGAVAVVVSSVPSHTAAKITKALRIPTIGIGSGPDCTGQMVLQSEVLGSQTPLLPEYHRRYANVGDVSVQALRSLSQDIQESKFPANCLTASPSL